MSASADPFGEKPWIAQKGAKLECTVTLLGYINTDTQRELTLRGLKLHTTQYISNAVFMYVYTGEMTQENRAAFDVQLRESFANGIKAGQINIEENSGGHIHRLYGKSAKGDISVFFAAPTVPKA